MRVKNRSSLPALLIMVILTAAIGGRAQDADLLRHFAYDQTAPLGINQIGVQHREHADVYDITYLSPKGGGVPAYLIVPKGKGPFAAVEAPHALNAEVRRDRIQFLIEQLRLKPLPPALIAAIPDLYQPPEPN